MPVSFGLLRPIDRWPAGEIGRGLVAAVETWLVDGQIRPADSTGREDGVKDPGSRTRRTGHLQESGLARVLPNANNPWPDSRRVIACAWQHVVFELTRTMRYGLACGVVWCAGAVLYCGWSVCAVAPSR